MNFLNYLKNFSSFLKQNKELDQYLEYYEPEVKTTLYCFQGLISSKFFDNESELESYVEDHDLSFYSIAKIEYLGNAYGRKDVIRKVNEKGVSDIYTAIDRDGYARYNVEKSKRLGKNIWEYEYGSLRELYSAFKDKGVILENDTYTKIDEEEKQLIKSIK